MRLLGGDDKMGFDFHVTLAFDGVLAPSSTIKPPIDEGKDKGGAEEEEEDHFTAHFVLL